MTILLKGADIMEQNCAESQACLSVSQTILFNCKKTKNRHSVAKIRHSLEYEPPLPLYIGLNIHTQTRSKKLVTQLFELGLSISYDRVLQLENQLATAVCQNMEKRVLCILPSFGRGYSLGVPWTTLITIHQVPLPKVHTMGQA